MYFYEEVLTTSDGTIQTALAGASSEPGYRNGVGIMARFHSPLIIFVINDTSLIIADTFNHCLRHMDRRTLMVSDFVGNCTSPGTIDGAGNQSKLHKPKFGILDREQPHQLIYLCDPDNFNLRTVNVNTRAVKTILLSLSLKNTGLIFWDNLDNHRILIDALTQTTLLVSYSLDKDYTTKSAVQKPERIEWAAPLLPGIYLITSADYVGVLDLNRKITTIVANFPSFVISSLHIGDQLYLSAIDGLKVLPGIV